MMRSSRVPGKRPHSYDSEVRLAIVGLTLVARVLAGILDATRNISQSLCTLLGQSHIQ